MTNKLHFKAVNPELLRTLKILMATHKFKTFRLVGGTALSLYRGHRQSFDIDLFTDVQYGSVNFDVIDRFLHKEFPYTVTSDNQTLGPGKSYFVGKNKDNCVKLDLFYTDPFIRKVIVSDGIRIAAEEEIIAMKIELISNGGRKKDFWDIHELMEDYSLEQMLSLHAERYPYGHDQKEIIKNLTRFDNADTDFDPICLKGKHWELIKLDLIEFAGSFNKTKN